MLGQNSRGLLVGYQPLAIEPQNSFFGLAVASFVGLEFSSLDGSLVNQYSHVSRASDKSYIRLVTIRFFKKANGIRHIKIL